jgi:hypothetical protein
MKTPIEALHFDMKIIKSFADDLQERLNNKNCDSRKSCEEGLRQAKDFIAQYEDAIKVLKISSNVPVMRSVCSCGYTLTFDTVVNKQWCSLCKKHC